MHRARAVGARARAALPTVDAAEPAHRAGRHWGLPHAALSGESMKRTAPPGVGEYRSGSVGVEALMVMLPARRLRVLISRTIGGPCDEPGRCRDDDAHWGGTGMSTGHRLGYGDRPLRALSSERHATHQVVNAPRTRHVSLYEYRSIALPDLRVAAA